VAEEVTRALWYIGAPNRGAPMTVTQLDGDSVYTVSEFLAPDECAAFVAQSEAAGYGDAEVAGVVVKDFRDNDRVLFDDAALAARLFGRALPFLPPVIEGKVPVGFNERFRFYRYGPGQTFKPHVDGAHHRFALRQASELTFLMYLNDDFTGGETNFFFDYALHLALGGRVRFGVRPVRGTALVFRHRLLHEGAPVLTGRKYVLRTDVMYGPP